MNILDDAPGPTPWYPHAGRQAIPGFRWSQASDSGGAAGVTTLSKGDEPVLLLDHYNYVSVPDPKTILFWHQRSLRRSGSTAPVMLRAFRIRELRPLAGGTAEPCGSMRAAGASFAAANPPLCELAIPTTAVNERRQMTYPKPLRQIEEILILCHSSSARPPGGVSDLALLVARPAVGDYELFPQDWFNTGDFDHGYQWVARVARNPWTGRVHGDGIRLSPFILDDTLRRPV